MDMSFSAIDVLYDSNFLNELEEKFGHYRNRTTSRGRQGSQHYDWSTARCGNDGAELRPSLGQLSTGLSVAHRSPSTDFDVSHFVYSFLKTQFLATTSRSSLSEGLINKKIPSLEKILESRWKPGQLKNSIPLQQQIELALLWRTINIFLGADDISLAIDFFREFLSTMEKFPPLSLSTQWKSTNQSCSVDVLERGIPNQSVCKKSKSGGDDEEELKNIEDDIPLLPIPELAYLNVNIDGRDQPRVDDMDGPIKTLPSHHDDLSSRSERDPQESATMAANLVDHDPLGVIQKLFDVTECLALAIPPCDRHVLLSVGLAIGTKAGRAALILAAASVLASSESVLNDTDIDIKVLKDMKTFVENKKARKSTRNDEGISPKGDNENISTIRAKKTCIAEGSPRSSNQSGTSNAYDLLKESILSSNYSSGGLVMSFGKADHGKLGHGDSQVHRAIPTVVESMKQCSIVKIASMSTYSVVVDNSGGVFVWGTGGSSGSMQGLRTDILPQPLEALVEKAPIISVACGLGHALFLLANGKVCAWGNGGNGRLGLGDTTDRAEACLIKDLVGEVIGSVQCGASHSMAITKKNGNVYIWGKNSQGQCGKGNLEDIQRPSFNATLQSETVVKMAAGWEHTIALTSNGLLYAWGSGYKDSRRGLVPPVLGLGHAEGRSLPELVVSIKDIRIIDIASGWDHCLALDSKNRVYSWGSGQNGKLGHNSEENVTAPCIIPTLDNVEVVQISAGCEHSGAITAAGELFTWGHGDGGRLGHGDSEARIVPTKVEALLQMHARPLTLHCGDKFTMIAVEAQTAERYSTKNLSDNSKVEEEPECNVFSMSWLHSIVDQHITSFKNLENPDKNVVCPGDLTLSELEKLGQNLDMDVEVEADSDTSSLISSEDSPDGITGKDVLLGVLSLMARSFDDDIFRNKKTLHNNTILVNENPGDSGVDIKPCLSYEYSVEISVQLFQSLLVILTLQSEELFEAEDMLEGEHTENDENGEHQQNDKHQHYDGDDVPNLKISCLAVDEVWAPTGVLHTKDKENDQSTTSNVKLPKSFLNWAILRCALAVLHSNLFVLNDICAQDNKGDVALKGLLSRHVSKAENKFTDNNNSLNEFMSSADEVPKGSFSASGRLASLLGVTSMSNLDEYDGLRSSDDEDDDDEEEDEEDDEDEEDEEDEDDDENASEDDEDEDCEDDDAGHMADMLDHLHDEGFEDDDMDNSKELLDEEVAKLAHAVMSLMEEDEQDHDHDIDQEEHDVSYGEEYDLGNDLYDNDNNEELDLDLEEGNNNIDVNTSTRNHQRSGGSNENELYQSTLGRQNFQDTEGGGGNNEREGNNSLHPCESNHHENDDSGHRNHNLDHDEGNDEVDKAICLSLSDAAKSHRDRNIIASGLDRHLSPAASQESLELSNRVAKSKSDDENSLKARSSNVIDDEKCHNGDQNSEIGEKHAELSERVEKPVAPIGEEEFYDDEDDDEDYQRAVSASLEDQNSIDVIQLMLQSKHVFKTNEVLPLLGKQLEYISRLCFDGIKSSRSSSMPNVKHDTPALVEMWKDLQSTICMGFQTLYSVEEQKELISYSIKNTENWMHMVPCVSMALSKDEFLLTSISSSSASKPLVKKKSKNNLTEERFEIPSNDDKHSTVKHPNEHDLKHSIDVSHICHALRNLKKYDIASTHLIKSIFGEADEALPRHGKREMKSTIQPDSRVIENIFEKDLHYILIHSSLNTMRSFVSFFLIKHIAGPLGNAFAPESSVEIQKITELLETIVQVINAELQELAANIPKKVALRYQGSKRTSLHEADDAMISRILKNSVSSKLLTCLGGFFVCNNANIKNVALFMPYAMQLLHIYQQSNCAFSDSSARCQHVCDIGTLLQKWLLTEMRWIVLFVSSAINIFFTVNEDKNLGRFKHSTAISISTFNKISSSPLIDINTIMSSLQHKAWIDIDDTVKIWCSVFFSEVKAKYFPSQDANELSPHKVDFEGTKDDPWALLMKDFSTYFFNFSKSPINNYQQLAKFDFEYSKWFTDFSSFFSLYSINWMANFAPTFEDLVSLTGLDVRCLALLITLAVDDDSEGSYNSIPLILSMIEVSKTSANELLDTISANRGDNFSTFFKNWIKSLRLFLFALFCRCYEMHTEVEKLKVLAMTRNLDKHSSSFVDKVVEIWFLVLVVSGIMVQKMLISVCTEDTNDKMLTSRMMNVLFKSIELANTAVKAFDVRSQDIDLLMADASEAECARVTSGSRWLVEGVVMNEGHSPYSSDKGSINQGLFYFHKLSDMASSSHDRALNHHPVLQNVADIAVFLLADISVSALENICLISHICYRSTIYGVQLCTETFSLLRESDEALRYFSAALELPQIKMKAFRSLYLNYEIRRTSSIHTAEWEGINNAQQNNNLLLYKLPHLKKQSQVICSLDNCITEIFASISKKISSDSTAAFGSKSVSKAIVPSINNFEYLDLQAAMLFPKLIDTLQYGIRSAIEDSSFRFNYLSLASPLFGLSTLMNLLQSVCSDDKADRKDEYFWKLTKLLRQYLLSAHNLQLTINDLSDLPSAASSLPPISDNASLVNTERGLDTLKNCDHLMKIVENITAGLGDMRLEITKQCVATDTKVYLPQIRLLDYSSPVIIPNTSTDFGNYSIGFWIKIPKGYKETSKENDNQGESLPLLSPRSNLQANSTQKRSTHILSRVPEAGEVDMFNLFKGVPTTLCNPGIILEVLPDGSALLVVTVTSTVDSDGRKNPSKKIRMVKLSSKPLPFDTWIDISLQYTCLFNERNAMTSDENIGNSKSRGEKMRSDGPNGDKRFTERSIVHLFVDGELHATAIDSFGRLSLHQNIVFGTTPVSLIKPNNQHECLQAGGVRWSAQTSYKAVDSDKTGADVDCSDSNISTLLPLNNSYPSGMSAMITINELRPSSAPLQIKMLYEPFVCVQSIQKDLSDIAQFSLKIAADFFMVHTKETLLRLHASLEYSQSNDPPHVNTTFNILTPKPQNSSAEKALGYLETLVTLLPSIGYRAVCLLGDCSYCDSLQESIFHYLNVNIDVLVSVKSCMDANARQLSSMGAKLRSVIQTASSALQQQTSFLLSIVEILVKNDCSKKPEQDTDDVFASSFPTTSSSSDNATTNSFGSSGTMGDVSSLLQYWLNRLHDSKQLREEKIYPTEMISAWILSKGYNNQKQNENGLVTNIASIVAKAVNSDLISISKIMSPVTNSFTGSGTGSVGLSGSGGGTQSTTSVHMLLVGFFAGGGWPVAIQSNSIVELYPRALFLHQDPKCLEHAVFPATARVRSASPIGGVTAGATVAGSAGGGMSLRPSGVWLHQCDGLFNRHRLPLLQNSLLGLGGKEPKVHFPSISSSSNEQDDGAILSRGKSTFLDYTSIVPRQQHLLIQSTEMVSARDAYVPLSLPNVAHVMNLTPMGNASSLLALLQRLSRLSSSVFTSSLSNKSNQVLPTKGIQLAPMEKPHTSVLEAALGGSKSIHDPPLSTSNVNETEEGGDNPALELTMCMSHIRSLLVQLATVECLQGDEKMNHLTLLQNILERDLHSLISIALLDPVNSVVQAFHKATAEQQQADGAGDHTSTGQQLDVLSNLLREGDICFLEKISLRVWRHFHNGDNTSKTNSGDAKHGKSGHSLSPRLQPAPISGEVQILGNRIRALSHFPSVKIYPVNLEKMSGRWFYECTLLSDGLMQIGWADRAFRSDPVCGQGVGDHLHSWAVDGLRTKKWNVSCEPYGTRWKVEDVIGVLVDMDLLEMKFFINGVDLGPAFINFQATGLYPAISLNVRQCLRVNYGQELFMFPPDVVDKLPYRPVQDAVNWKSPTKKASKNVEKIQRNTISTPSESVDVEQVERITIVQSESANPGHISARVGSAVPGRRLSRGNVHEPSRGNNSSSEEEAARHAAMVVSAAHAQQAGLTSGVGGGAMNDSALEESVDERQIREGVHTENSEVSTEANAWAEMGQNLSRRGSRIGLSPRANVSASTDGGGISDAAQRLLQLAAAGGEESMQKDGSDENEDEKDDDKDDDDDDDDDNDQAVMRFFQQQQRHEHRAEVRGTSTEVEARRQQLIENLIGMGFPIDWSLRAAEHCDANVSESVAIAWIIERMELEHAKMEEMDGGEDSRMAEEMEEGDENHVEDEPNARSIAGQQRTNFGFHGQGSASSHIDDNNDSKESNSNASNSNLNGSGTKPVPKPPVGTRGGGGAGAGGGPAGAYSRSSKVNQLNHDIFTGSACSTGGYQDQGTWNNEDLSYATILVGHESARRRFDMDKQAVLSQISELDFCDLFPIVLSCQFSLCIFYARCAFIRIIRMICGILRKRSPCDGNSTLEESVDCGVQLHALGENFLKLLLEKPSDSTCSNSTALSSLVNLLEICFKQGQGASHQPDKLFPSLLKGTTAGDPIDTCPTVAPFTSHNSRSMTETLSMLELAVFAYYEDSRMGYRAPKVISTIAMEESSLQSSSVMMSFLGLITERSFRYNTSIPSNFTYSFLEDCPYGASRKSANQETNQDKLHIDTMQIACIDYGQKYY